MGIFYKTTQDIMFESGLTYDLAEIVTEAFNPIAAVKKFFAAILKKIKDFFTKIFSKKSTPVPTHKTPEPKSEQPSPPPPVSKDYAAAKRRYDDINRELRIMEHSPVSAPKLPSAVYMAFLADDALQYLKTFLDDLSKTYMDLVVDAIEEIQHHAEYKKSDMSFTAAVREINMDATLDVKLKKIEHGIAAFKEFQSSDDVEEPEEGEILSIDVNKFMPKKEDYIKPINAVVADFVKSCNRETERLILHNEDLFANPSLTTEMNRHFVKLTQHVSSLVVTFTKQFDGPDIGLTKLGKIAIDNYNEKRIRYAAEQDTIKRYKAEKESLIAVHGSFE